MFRRLNFYGGPGLGKSGLAAFIFGNLKRLGANNVELVHEWIKGWAWDGYVPQGNDQLYVFAKQLRAEERVLRRGGVVISDSPILMQLAYVKRNNPHLYRPLLKIATEHEKKYPAFNVLLTRSVPYKKEGRYETKEQAVKMDAAIEKILTSNKVEFTRICPINDDGNLLRWIEHELEFEGLWP